MTLKFSLPVLKARESRFKSGGYSEEVTPVPIPNTVVKLFCADGNWGLSPCESRSLPGKAINTRFSEIERRVFFWRIRQTYNLSGESLHVSPERLQN